MLQEIYPAGWRGKNGVWRYDAVRRKSPPREDREEGWPRHQEDAATPPYTERPGGRSASKLLRALRMGQRRSGTYNTARQKEFRKRLRNSMTAAECVLWQSLKGRQLLGKKFRRQISIGRYVVDFYCPEARLVIELDGESHFSITMDEYEAERTKYLEQEGLTVIRFENKQLYDNLEGVLETIKQALQKGDVGCERPPRPLLTS